MQEVFVVLSIDVEEEGLFSGRYPRDPVGVSNVAELSRLACVTTDFGVPLTLLADYPVLNDRACLELLVDFRKKGAEIGTHLHHWNTPPFEEVGLPEPVKAGDIPGNLLRDKLTKLTDAYGMGFGEQPVSFRMGRFDLAPKLRPLLVELGYQVDSSVVPYRYCAGTMDQLFGPQDPYLLPAGDGKLLEVPVTMVPASQLVEKVTRSICAMVPEAAQGIVLSTFRKTMAFGPHPAWSPLGSMKNAARLHIGRGGRVINIFLHSTEIALGMSPASATASQREKVLGKLRSFLTWLTKNYAVKGATLSQLPNLL